MLIVHDNETFVSGFFQVQDDVEFLEQFGLQYIHTPLHLVVVYTRPDGTDVFKLDNDHVLLIEYSKVQQRITYVYMYNKQAYRWNPANYERVS
jgi:hypothetical protein